MYAAWVVTANTETQVRAATNVLIVDGLRFEPMLGFFRSQERVVDQIDRQGRMVLTNAGPADRFRSDPVAPDVWWSQPWFYGEWKQLVLQEIALS